jgi:hypothetical protein
MCKKRKEEIYEINGKIGEKELQIIDYESNLIQELIDKFDLDLDKTNWLDFIDDKGWKLEIYPYYIETSEEEIRVMHESDNIVGTRPLMVEGMPRHTKSQLRQLRQDKIFKTGDLADIEHWHGKTKNDRLPRS